MAKTCTFESYLRNGDPWWCCSEPSTKKLSMDVVDEANEYWQDNIADGEDGRLWVVYTDLCDAHAKLANEVYDNRDKPKEVKDGMHIQVDQT